MQLLVLIGGGITVAVGTVFAQNWVEARLEARRVARRAARAEAADHEGVAPGGGEGVPVGPGSGVPERAAAPVAPVASVAPVDPAGATP